MPRIKEVKLQGILAPQTDTCNVYKVAVRYVVGGRVANGSPRYFPCSTFPELGDSVNGSFYLIGFPVALVCRMEVEDHTGGRKSNNEDVDLRQPNSVVAMDLHRYRRALRRSFVFLGPVLTAGNAICRGPDPVRLGPRRLQRPAKNRSAGTVMPFANETPVGTRRTNIFDGFVGRNDRSSGPTIKASRSSVAVRTFRFKEGKRHLRLSGRSGL